jgi:hypothetical protein
MKRKLWVYVMLLAGVVLFATTPSYATTTVGFTKTDNGNGTWTYLWTVNYDGLNSNGFGQLEVYLPKQMNSATNNSTTLNSANLITTGQNPYDSAGPTVTWPKNAANYPGGHTG